MKSWPVPRSHFKNALKYVFEQRNVKEAQKKKSNGARE